MEKENDIKQKRGISFLNRLYKDLHLSDEVMHTATKSDTKDEKVEKYLNRLGKVEELARNSKYNGMELLKELYHKKYVIKKENFPESYFKLQKKIAFERGYGRIEYTDSEKEEMMRTAIMDQKKSLDMWFDYLMSKDAIYPEWFKYYAFQGMLKLGEYDKGKGKFGKRTPTTASKFVDLNREALAYIYSSLVKMMNQENIEDEDLSRLCEGGSFEKLYTYTLQKLEKIRIDTSSKDGIWIKYDRGNEPEKLVATLEGRGTGWCTAGLETARAQLRNGDFYVYYTKTDSGEYDQPRIAIRMEGANIGEIRGIAEHQNMEAEMEEVLEEKLEEFPDRDNYKKKVSDMKKMTEIYNSYKIRDLTKEELWFLYEINEKIQGFGYGKDPRIKEILDDRNFREDLALLFHCSSEEITDNLDDVIYAKVKDKKIVCFYGDLQLYFLDSWPAKLELPDVVVGSLNLCNFTSAKDIVLPRIVSCSLYLDNLTSTEGLILPNYIGRSLYLNSLASAKGLVLPKSISHSLRLDGLTSAEGLVLPETVGELNLSGLTSAEGLVLPNYIESLYLNSLASAKGLVLPKSISHSLRLDGLTSAEGLVLPSSIGKFLDLGSLTSAKGLVLPETVGELNLSGLTSAEGLVLPDHVGGSLFLDGLTSAKDLVLPDYIECSLYLDGLTSAEDLVLSCFIGKDLCMSKLQSLDGICFAPKFNLSRKFRSSYISDEEFKNNLQESIQEQKSSNRTK